jgi:hypothetical protein
MQQGDRSIELDLGSFGAGDGKGNRAQGVTGGLVDLDAPCARTAPKQDDHHRGTGVPEGGTTGALH